MKKQKTVDPYKAAAGDDTKYLAAMFRQSELIAKGVSKMTRQQVEYWVRRGNSEEPRRIEKDWVIQLVLLGAFAGMSLAGAKRKVVLGKAKRFFAYQVYTNFARRARKVGP
jgi:hypothetical protein